jgi:hypothetical protein
MGEERRDLGLGNGALCPVCERWGAETRTRRGGNGKIPTAALRAPDWSRDWHNTGGAQWQYRQRAGGVPGPISPKLGDPRLDRRHSGGWGGRVPHPPSPHADRHSAGASPELAIWTNPGQGSQEHRSGNYNPALAHGHSTLCGDG